MIRGLGIDLCAIDEMATRLDDLASMFAAAHFTPTEMSEIRSRGSQQPAQHAAARFAAKEACLKALASAAGGRQLVPQVDFREIEVVTSATQPPYLMLHGALRTVARQLGIERILLSITHEGNFAAAVVTIE